MFTPLFTNAKNAGFFGSLGTIILSLIGLVYNYVDTDNAAKWATCLLSPVALSLSLQPVSILFLMINSHRVCGCAWVG